MAKHSKPTLLAERKRKSDGVLLQDTLRFSTEIPVVLMKNHKSNHESGDFHHQEMDYGCPHIANCSPDGYAVIVL